MKGISTKTPISLRLEPELLNWYRSQKPKGYQSLIHSVLKRYMQEMLTQKIRAAGRAQEIFHRYYARCFWHYDPKLEITPHNIDLVIEGLKKYGGREGFLLAEELCQ